NDASPQGGQHRLAIQAVLQQGIENHVERLPVFVFFAVGQLDPQHAPPGLGQCFLDALGIQASHGGIGHESHCGCVRRAALRQVGQTARADVDGIGSPGSLDVYSVHRACSCCSNSVTRSCTACGIGVLPVSKASVATS